MKYFIIVSFSILLISSCISNASNEKSRVENYNFDEHEQITISSKLNEISDLTTSNDDNVFAINDEIGIIYKLNPLNGKIIKRFYLGRWTVEADFEGIARSNDYIYALTSEGVLYTFREGENETAVDYETTSLPFTSKFDLEGLYYDEELKGLLIVPKEYAGKKYSDYRTIYFYSTVDKKIDKDPLIKISLKELKKNHGVKDFYPSAITKHPVSKNYLIISAKNKNVLVEISKEGKIMGVVKLKESLHRQPEGITILKDNTLLISDEASGKKPTLTKYKYVVKGS